MNPEQYEGKLEDVVEYEMASHVGSSIRQFRIRSKEVPYVAKLQDQESDPFESCLAWTVRDDGENTPVQIGNKRIEGKRGGMGPVLFPDGWAAVGRKATGNADNQDQDP